MSDELIIQDYLSGLSVPLIATKYKTYPKKIYRILENTETPRHKTKKETKQRDLEILDLCNRGVKLKEISKIMLVSIATVSRTLKTHNADIHRNQKRDLKIIEMYIEGFSMQEVGKFSKIHTACVFKILKKNKIKTRSKSQNKRDGRGRFTKNIGKSL